MTAPVNDSTSPMTDIHDIKPALAFGAQWPWWIWVTLVLVAVALVGLIWWLRRRRRHSDETIAAEPALPPDVEAFQHLDLLAARGGADPKQFYFALSAILRRYVERRYDFPAAEMTTEELLPEIRQLDLTEGLSQEVKRFCRYSDPIKFAGAVSSQTGMSTDLAFVRQFVEQTTEATIEKEEGDIPTAKESPAPAQKQLPGRSLQTQYQTPNTKH